MLLQEVLEWEEDKVKKLLILKLIIVYFKKNLAIKVEAGKIKETKEEELVSYLFNCKNIVIVPGYGMA